MPNGRRRGPRVPEPSRLPDRHELARLRRVLGHTQEEFAVLLGVDRSTVSKIENGERHPSQLLLERMAEVTRKSQRVIEQLLYGSDEVGEARSAS